MPAVSEAAEGLEDLELERGGLAVEQALATRAFTREQAATTEAHLLGAVHEEEAAESVLTWSLLGCC